MPSSGLSFNPAFSFRRFSVFFYDSGWALVRSLTDATQAHSFGSAIGRFEGGDIPLLPSVFGTSHRYSRFSMLLFFLGLGLLMTKYPVNSRLKKNNKLLLASIFSSFLGIIISGVRSAFVLTSAGSVLFFYSLSILEMPKYAIYGKIVVFGFSP